MRGIHGSVLKMQVFESERPRHAWRRCTSDTAGVLPGVIQSRKSRSSDEAYSLHKQYIQEFDVRISCYHGGPSVESIRRVLQDLKIFETKSHCIWYHGSLFKMANLMCTICSKLKVSSRRRWQHEEKRHPHVTRL